jgi:hypothetical protein
MENKENTKFKGRLPLIKRDINRLPLQMLKLFCQYLCWIDTASFRFSNKELFKVPQPCIGKEIKRRLGIMFPGDTEFIPSLIKSESVISGGFLLRCLYGIKDEWGESDIDIYIKNKDIASNNHSSFFEWNPHSLELDDKNKDYISSRNSIFNYSFFLEWNPHSLKLDEKNKSKFRKYKYNSRRSDNEMVEGGANEILRNESLIHVMKYEIDKIKVDYIMVNAKFKNGVADFIKNMFDISICKNIFDGKQLYIGHIMDLINRQFYHELKIHPIRDQDFYYVMNIYNGCIDIEEGRKREMEYTRAKNIANNRVKKYTGRKFTCIDSKISIKEYNSKDYLDD